MLGKGDWVAAAFDFQDFFSDFMVSGCAQNTVTQWGKWDLIYLKLKENKKVILRKQLSENQINSVLFLRLGRF